MSSDGASTPWEKMSVSFSTSQYLRGTHTLWSRLMNGDHFFAALPNRVEPINGQTMGHHHIADALKAEGLF
jgi:hypothetical protein